MSNVNMMAVLELVDKVSPTLSKIALPLEKTKKAFDEAKDALKAFEGQSKLLDSFARRTDQLAVTQTKLAAAERQFKALSQAMQSAESPSRRLVAQHAAAEKKVTQLKARLGEQKTELLGLSEQLKKAGINTDNFAEEQARLAKNITAATVHLDQQQAALDRQNRLKARYESIGAGAQKVRDVSVKAAAVGTAATVIPAKLAIDYESAMADVKKVVDFGDEPALAAQGFKQLSQEVLHLSTLHPMSASDIASIVALGGQSGIAKEELINFADGAVRMGVAFDIGAAEAGQAMSELRTAFNLSQSEVVTLADKINYLGNTTPAAAKDIMGIVQRIGPLGEVGGFASGSIASLGATLKGMGVAEDVAATGIKNMMLALVAGESATRSQQAAFARLGLDHATIARDMQADAEATTLKVLEAVSRLSAHEQAATLGQLFGKESLGAIAPLLTNLEALRQNLSAVGDEMRYAGSMNAEYDARAATTANALTRLKNSMTAIGISLGSTLLPLIAAVSEKLAGVAQRVLAWSEVHPTAAKAVMMLVAGLAALFGGLAVVSTVILSLVGPLALLHASFSALGMGGVLTTLGSVLGTLGGAFMRILSVVRMVGMALAANPIVLAAAAIAAAALYIWQNWGTLGPKFSALWQTLSAGASALWGRIVSIWNGIRAGVTAAAGGLWTALSGRFSAGVQILIGIIARFNPVSLFIRAFSAVFGFFAGLSARFASYGGQMIEGLKRGIMNRVEAVIGAIQNAAGRIKSVFTGLMGIHSPSRVFKGYGTDIMAGLNLGLLANKSPITAMTATSDALKAAMDTDGITFTGSAAGVPHRGFPQTAAAPRSIVINVYAKEGQSEQEIARLVKDALDRQEAQKTGLYDYMEAWT